MQKRLIKRSLWLLIVLLSNGYIQNAQAQSDSTRYGDFRRDISIDLFPLITGMVGQHTDMADYNIMFRLHRSKQRANKSTVHYAYRFRVGYNLSQTEADSGQLVFPSNQRELIIQAGFEWQKRFGNLHGILATEVGIDAERSQGISGNNFFSLNSFPFRFIAGVRYFPTQRIAISGETLLWMLKYFPSPNNNLSGFHMYGRPIHSVNFHFFF
ncbi:hypothetical protein [Rhodoflexus sp.]